VILSQGEKGGNIVSQLIKESPGFQDNARLYFTRELFGKGQVPTKKVFDTFLFNNKVKLQASGLYDEFSSLRGAQQSAVNAVNDAKGLVSTGKEAITAASARSGAIKRDLTSAKQSRQILERKLTSAEKLRGQAAERAAPLEKAATEQRLRALGYIGEPAATVAARISQAERRAQDRVKELTGQAKTFGEQSKELQRSIDDLAKEVGVSEKQIADLQILRQKINSIPAESIGDAKKFYGDLLSAKKIDEAAYTKAANELDQLQQQAREGRQVQNAMYAVMGSALGSALVTGALK
jgi:chromosome segregation ATPase